MTRIRILVALSLLASALVANVEGFTPYLSKVDPNKLPFVTNFHVLPNESNSAVDRVSEHETEQDFEEIPELLNDEEATQGTREHNSEGSASHHHKLSKSKWKKKRYLIMKDVSDRIQRSDPKAVHKAEEMIRRFWQLYEKTGNDDYIPSTRAYNLWINAIAKSSQQDSGVQAEQILRDMRVQGVMPNVVSFSSVMDAYARQARSDEKAPAEAERILFELLEESEYNSDLKVTAVTSDIVLNAWAQLGTVESAKRAQQILERLESLGGSSTNIRPTAHSYATVVHGWAASKGGARAAEHAQGILDRLLKNDDGNVKPDTVIWNGVIDAWAKSGDAQAGSKAVALLKRMQEYADKDDDSAPDIITYNTVLSAWSHCGHMNAAVQAERILQDMLASHKEDETAVKPTAVSYNNVLHAWSKSRLEGAPERAEKILDFMIRSNDKDVAPDVYSFSSVLDALAKSKEPDKAIRAGALLDTLLEMYTKTKMNTLKPSQVSFNTVLNAAAFSALGTTEQQQRDALQVAVHTFSLMRKEGILPDAISYGNMLKCFANLMPQGEVRSSMALQVFEKCCEEGLVGDLCWNEVRRAVPAKLLAERMDLRGSIKTMEVRDLPRKWTRNVRVFKKRSRDKKPKVDPAEERRRMPVKRFRNISEASYQSGRDL